MRVRGEAGRGMVTVVVLLFVAVSLGIFLTGRGFADSAKNPVSGGGPKKSDCYIELDVQGVTATEVKGQKQVTCIDGDPCDTDGMCDGTCSFKVALCPNQAGVTGCTPHPPITLSGKSLNAPLIPPTDLSGSACGAFADVKVAVKKGKGKKKDKPGKTVLHIKAKSSGKPKTDADNVKFICKPRSGTCPATTTTTTPCTTPTTLPCTAPASSLSFTTAPGTTSCGGAGLNPAPAAPASGELDSDTAGATKITDLGLACLYFGGGNGTVVPPGLIPDNAASYFSVTGGTNLVATSSCGPTGCTKGAGPGKHCVNAHCNTDADCDNSTGSCAAGQCKTGTQATPLPCTTDNDCGASAGSCGLDANCYFGPPLPILSPPPQGALTTCVLNVIQSDGTGTVNTSTGSSTVSLPLSSRVYITGNTSSPCPKCVCGTCNYGENAGKACSTNTTLGTTLDCLPILKNFQAPLPVTLNPLTTGTTALTAADGVFCSFGTCVSGQCTGTPKSCGVDADCVQTTPGAFGKGTAQRIAETGAPGGNLTDNLPHQSVLASVFCIPGTGNPAVDGVADLPGPGAIGLNGTAKLNP